MLSGDDKNDNATNRPEDCPTAWFAMLERAQLDGDTQREATAQQELRRLGVRVEFDPGSERQTQRGIIGLVAKASALVDQAKELLDRLEQEGEIVIEMQTTLRIQVPRRAMRGDDDAN